MAVVGYLLLAALLLAVDMGIKAWASTVLLPIKSIPVIEGVFSLYYHENRGAAWGIFQGERTFLLVVTGVMLLAVLYLLVARRVQGRWLNFALALIVAGGFGNWCDRMFRGYVIDYLYFQLIDFPIFNFADMCVVGGTIIIVCYVVFVEGREKKKAVTEAPEQDTLPEGASAVEDSPETASTTNDNSGTAE